MARAGIAGQVIRDFERSHRDRGRERQAEEREGDSQMSHGVDAWRYTNRNGSKGEEGTWGAEGERRWGGIKNSRGKKRL